MYFAKKTIILFIAVILNSCNYQNSSLSKEKSVIENNAKKKYKRIEPKYFDTLWLVQYYPEKLVLFENKAVYTVQKYEDIYDSLIEIEFNFPKVKPNLDIGKSIDYYFNMDSSNFHWFTSQIDTNITNLNSFSFFKSNIYLKSYPVVYRGGPTYFHLERREKRWEFDIEKIESISYISEISKNRFFVMYNEQAGIFGNPYNFKCGIFNLNMFEYNDTTFSEKQERKNKIYFWLKSIKN